ncbi:MAG TPA: hypothetical protein VH309_07765 [Elusimicrobiota bacterium]|nr:hypothetical protein [Elusimicrobiota bacterium]
MKTKDETLTEIGVMTIIGRTALPIGLTLLLTRAFFGHPARLAPPLAGTAAGILLLAGAASRLDDAGFLTSELVRGLAFAAMIISALSVRFYFHRVPHALSPRELRAGLACAAGFAGAVVWLRTRRA